jgi:hypothetical protein
MVRLRKLKPASNPVDAVLTIMLAAAVIAFGRIVLHTWAEAAVVVYIGLTMATRWGVRRWLGEDWQPELPNESTIQRVRRLRRERRAETRW